MPGAGNEANTHDAFHVAPFKEPRDETAMQSNQSLALLERAPIVLEPSQSVSMSSTYFKSIVHLTLVNRIFRAAASKGGLASMDGYAEMVNKMFSDATSKRRLCVNGWLCRELLQLLAA